IDGNPVNEFVDISQHLATGTGRDSQNRPMALFVIERDGQQMEKTLYPRVNGVDRLRQIGIAPLHTVEVGALIRDFPAQAAGVEIGDRLTAVDGQPVYSTLQVHTYIQERANEAIEFTFVRDGKEFSVTMTPMM